VSSFTIFPQVESLYPSELGPDAMSTNDFLESGLAQVDKSMEERVKAASLKGNVLRYVCEIGSSRYVCCPVQWYYAE
jgi:homoserine dehydrogenase